MKTKAYIGNCPNCGRECMSGLKTTSCWNCETEFTIPTDIQEISYVNSASIESKGCANEKAPCEDAISRQAVLDALCDGCKLFKNGEQTCFTKCEEYHFLATLPPVTPQPKHEDVAKAFQFGMALGFGEKHDEMDKVMKEVKKAISPEQEPSSNAIDRKLVCAFINGLISDDREREKGLEYIKHMPPVTSQYTDAEIQKMQDLEQAEIKKAYELGKAVQPKTGHWIKEESIYGWDGKSYQCSECGRSIHLDLEVEDLSDYPYCHCGAKMVEPQESEE